MTKISLCGINTALNGRKSMQMKKVHCHDCGNQIDNNEIALNLKLLGKQIGIFRCYHCLSGYLGCDTIRLKEMADYFKNSGCILFQTDFIKVSNVTSSKVM
jgi:hypothetical protein